jgi:hypothetical protein
MATILQFRRYDTSTIDGTIGEDGEIFIEKRTADDSRGIRIQDGVTPGGRLLTTAFADISGTLSDNTILTAALNLKVDKTTYNTFKSTLAGDLAQKVDQAEYDATVGALAASVSQGGLVDIADDVNSVAVLFPIALQGTPSAVVVTIRKAAAADFNIFGSTRLVSSTGFTVDLSATTDSANYKLEYIVIGV